MDRKKGAKNMEKKVPFLKTMKEGWVSSQRKSRFEGATWLLATFIRSHRSLRSLAPQRSVSLCLLAPFTGLLTHLLTPSWDG